MPRHTIESVYEKQFNNIALNQRRIDREIRKIINRLPAEEVILPTDGDLTFREWRRMSGGSAANLDGATVYYTDITPDSSATWIYFSPLYRSGNTHFRASNWGKVLYNDWSSGDVVSVADGTQISDSSNSRAHEFVHVSTHVGAWGDEDNNSEILLVGRTSTGEIAIYYHTGEGDPDVQGVRVAFYTNNTSSASGEGGGGASGGSGSSTLIGLNDVDIASFTAGQWLKVNSSGTAIIETNPPSGALTDEEFQDKVGSMAGNNLTYDDNTGMLNAAISSSGLDQDAVDARINALVPDLVESSFGTAIYWGTSPSGRPIHWGTA